MLLTVERQQLDALAHRTSLNEPQRVAEVLTGTFRKIAISFVDGSHVLPRCTFLRFGLSEFHGAGVGLDQGVLYMAVVDHLHLLGEQRARLRRHLDLIVVDSVCRDESRASSGGGSVGGKAGGSGGRDARGLG